MERVEVAGPGFLNIFVTDGWLYDALRDVVADAARPTAPGSPTASASRWSSSARTRPGPLHVGHARNAVLGDAIARCSSTRVGASSASTTTTTPVARWTGSARPSRRGYLSASRHRDGDPRGRVPRLLHRCAGARGRRRRSAPPTSTCRTRNGSPLVRQCGAERVLRWIDRTLRALRGGVRYLHVRGVARGEARDRRGDRTAARGGAHLRGGRSGVVPLHDVRRRQGSRGDPLERHPHVLRRGLRVRHRQVLARVRPPDLRLGRRPPRRRRAREGCRPGARLRSRRGRDRALPVGGVPPRRRRPSP